MIGKTISHYRILEKLGERGHGGWCTRPMTRRFENPVISRNSEMTFKETNKKVPDIARELDVRYVLEGNVRKAGRSLKTTAHWLDNAVTGGFVNYPVLSREPHLENLRGEERFKKLLKGVKVEWEQFEAPE